MNMCEHVDNLIQELRETITVLKEENKTLRQEIHQLEAEQEVSGISRSVDVAKRAHGIFGPIINIGE